MDYIPRLYADTLMSDSSSTSVEGVLLYRIATWAGTVILLGGLIIVIRFSRIWPIGPALLLQSTAAGLGWWRFCGSGLPVNEKPKIRLLPMTILMFLRMQCFLLSAAAAYYFLLLKTSIGGWAALLQPSDLSVALSCGAIALAIESIADIFAGVRGLVGQMTWMPKAENPLFMPLLGLLLGCVMSSFAIAAAAPAQHAVATLLGLSAISLVSVQWIIASGEKLAERPVDANHRAVFFTFLELDARRVDTAFTCGLLGRSANLTRPAGWLYLISDLMMLLSEFLVIVIVTAP